MLGTLNLYLLFSGPGRNKHNHNLYIAYISVYVNMYMYICTYAQIIFQNSIQRINITCLNIIARCSLKSSPAYPENDLALNWMASIWKL